MMRRPSRRKARTLVRAPAPGPWDPSRLAGYAFDYDAESYAGGTLLDLSGNGRDLSQADPAKRPAQVSRNGQLALQFGGGQWLRAVFGAPLAQPLTAYVVWEPTADVNQIVFDGASSPDRLLLYSTTSTLRAGSVARINAPGVKPGAAIATAICFDGPSSGLYGESDFVVPGASGDVGSAALGGLTIGAAIDNTSAMTGYIWRVTGYLGAHDAPTRKLMGDYLSARYSITIVT